MWSEISDALAEITDRTGIGGLIVLVAMMTAFIGSFVVSGIHKHRQACRTNPKEEP